MRENVATLNSPHALTSMHEERRAGGMFRSALQGKKSKTNFSAPNSELRGLSDAKKNIANENEKVDDGETQNRIPGRLKMVQKNASKATKTDETLRLSREAGMDKLSQTATGMATKWAWGSVASVVGFIFGVVALNIIALASALSDKIQLKMRDKIGIFGLDMAIILIVIFFASIFVVIFSILEPDPTTIPMIQQKAIQTGNFNTTTEI